MTRSHSNFLICMLFALLGLTQETQAATYFGGHVVEIGKYAEGTVFVYLDGPVINEPGCVQGQARIEIPATHPQLKDFLAMFIAAKASGAAVAGRVNTCSPLNNFAAFDTTAMSYLVLQ